MRSVILACAFAATGFAAASSGVPGPRQNPDDQFRFFWLYEPRTLRVLADSGFNLFMNDVFPAYSARRETYDAGMAKGRTKWMDDVYALGLDYMDQVCIPQRPDFVSLYPRLNRDGTTHNNADMGWSKAIRAAEKGVRLAAESINRHPACIGIEPSSEVRDHARPSFREDSARRYREATGEAIPPEVDTRRVAPHYLQLPDFPASRVVDEGYRLLKYYAWYWKTGDGWNDYQTRTKEIYEEVLGRKLLSMYDPSVRTPPLWGSGGNLSHINQWTYPTPEPYNIHYVISEQQAMARGCPGQRVFSMVQAISYRSRLAPKEKKVANPPAWLAARPNVVYMTTPPDIMREALWACFSHEMDGVGVFAWRALFDRCSGKWGPKDDPLKPGYQFTNGETIDVISNVFNTVGRPLGPLFRAIPERAPEVAVLESYASTFFANRGSWGWDGFIYAFGTQADAAHLQPYVLYEEEIARDGIPPTLKVILAPHCDVLTRTTFRALLDFQAKGGIIAADNCLVPGILPDLPIRGFRRTWEDGAASEASLKKAAADLRDSLKPFYRPPADSDNDCIITFVRSYKSADYLFAINDKREFGDYVGQWKMVMEKGCPNAGRVTLRRTAGAVYDLVRHERIGHRVLANGDTEVSLSYETTDGKCLLFVDRELSALKVEVGNGRVAVTSGDRDVLVPIEIRVDGLAPRYAVVRDGAYVWDCPQATPENVRVLNQADGRLFAVRKWWQFWR